MTGLQILGVPGIPEIVAGTDLAATIAEAAAAAGMALADGDIVVVTSKIVSKAEGRVDRTCRRRAVARSRVEWSAKWDKDPAVTEVVLREAKRIVRQVGPVLITETQHGFVCANSGVDQSSSGAHGRLVVLPTDPDASARRIRAGLAQHGVDVAVIISDTFGRAWREGQTDIAIGIAGMQPIYSYIGQFDPHGHEFKVQAVCLADELAGAAELVKGNISRVPVGVIRGYELGARRHGDHRPRAARPEPRSVQIGTCQNRYRVERTIRADAGELYDLVSDLPRMGEWSPENTGGRWVNGAAGPVVGARFKGTNQSGWRKWKTDVVVTVARARRALQLRRDIRAVQDRQLGIPVPAGWRQDHGDRNMDRSPCAGSGQDRGLFRRRARPPGSQPREHGGNVGQAGGRRRGVTTWRCTSTRPPHRRRVRHCA